jgi:hypothetical protein
MLSLEAEGDGEISQRWRKRDTSATNFKGLRTLRKCLSRKRFYIFLLFLPSFGGGGSTAY